MASGKFGMNLIFATVAALLALTAATFYAKSVRTGHRFAEVTVPSGSMPQTPSSGDTAKTIADLEQLAGRDPRNPEYPSRIGNIYYDLGQYEKALTYYQRSLTLHPGNPSVETDLATCYHYLGQDDKALETLDKVLEYAPGFSQAMFNKGIVLINGKKNVQGGIKVWEDLLRSNPDFPHKAELEARIGQLKGSAQ